MSAKKAFLFKGVLKCSNPWASGAPPPQPPPGALPLDPTGALKRAPGPHAVKARVLCALELTLRVRNYF